MAIETISDAHIGDDPIAWELTAARLYVAAIERGEDISGTAALAMLRKLPKLREHVDSMERVLTEHALACGHTWDSVAAETGRTSRQAAQQRHARLGGPVTGDVTPPELTAEAIAAYGAPAWAEPAPTPLEVTDWDTRQAQARIPFDLDGDGWPVNPARRTGRTGRNLPRWGENQAADALVFAGTGHDRKILLIQRDDVGTWAMPGGKLDPGESSEHAMVRELHEEAGLDLTGHSPVQVRTGYVDDHRASDHAWMTTSVGTYVLDTPADLAAGDDAAAAAWWPAADIQDLYIALTAAGGELHSPHSVLIAAGLDQIRDH